jgi:hypothetical protein
MPSYLSSTANGAGNVAASSAGVASGCASMKPIG